MPLSTLLDAVTNDVPRHAARYADAASRRPALAPFANPTEVLAALRRTSTLSNEDRDAVVVALVEEAQSSAYPLAQSMLVAAFAPMLQRLRGRLGRPRDVDLDQRVLCAFLEATRSVKPGPYTTIVLRWSTEKTVFAAGRAEMRMPPMLEFNEETHPADVFGIDDVAKEKAAEVIRALGLDTDDALLDFILTTRAGDVSLKDYVAREYADRSDIERAREYERLCRTRLRVEAELRARLSPRKAA